jgi:hypothetical protein
LIAVVGIFASGDDPPGLGGSFLMAALLWGSVGAFLQRTVLVGPTMYPRGTLCRWSALSAADVTRLTLHYEWGGRLPEVYRTLRIYGKDGTGADFSFLWWADTQSLVRWLVMQCTQVENDELVWAVKTDEKTRSRLQPLVQPFLIERGLGER